MDPTEPPCGAERELPPRFPPLSTSALLSLHLLPLQRSQQHIHCSVSGPLMRCAQGAARSQGTAWKASSHGPAVTLIVDFSLLERQESKFPLFLAIQCTVLCYSSPRLWETHPLSEPHYCPGYSFPTRAFAMGEGHGSGKRQSYPIVFKMIYMWTFCKNLYGHLVEDRTPVLEGPEYKLLWETRLGPSA